MNVVTTTQPGSGLSGVIAQLQKQKDELSAIYLTAISKGEKLHEVKLLYLNLKDIDKRLNDLMRVCF